MLPSRFYKLFDHMSSIDSYNIKCDVYEKDGVYHVEADIPGFKKEEIRINFNKGNIIISAEKSDETENEDKKYLHRERRYGKCIRSFYIGEIDEDRIEAKFENGTLYIIAPKKELTESRKTIEIK